MKSNGSIQGNVDKVQSSSARCFLLHHPPAEARCEAGQGSYESLDESGFGGWADEKIKTVREAVSLLSQKKFHPQHLTISLYLTLQF